MEQNDNFEMMDELGIFKNAELLTQLKIEGKEYIVYKIDKENDNCDIFVNKIIKKDGKIIVEDITNALERAKVFKIIENMFKEEKVH